MSDFLKTAERNFGIAISGLLNDWVRQPGNIAKLAQDAAPTPVQTPPTPTPVKAAPDPAPTGTAVGAAAAKTWTSPTGKVYDMERPAGLTGKAFEDWNVQHAVDAGKLPGSGKPDATVDVTPEGGLPAMRPDTAAEAAEKARAYRPPPTIIGH